MMTKRKLKVLPALLLGLSLHIDNSAAAEREVTLNLRDAELMAVLEMYSKLTGKAFVPAEQINGKVTIITPRPIPESQAVKMLFSILDMRGFAVAEVDNYYKVIPKASALQSVGTTLRPGTAGDRLITEVIKPKHIAANSLLESARNLVSQDAKLVADQTLNILVLTDTASNVEKLKAVVNDLDRVADAQVTRSYQLQYAKVDSLAPLIDAMLQGKSGASTAPSASPLSASSGGAAGGAGASAAGGGGMSMGGGMAGGMGMAGGGGGAQNGAVLQDVRSNTMIITASEFMQKQIDGVLRSLDRRSAQVLLGATIVEVTLTQNSKLGMQWRFLFNRLNGTAEEGVSLADGSAGQSVNPLLTGIRTLPAIQGLSFALLKPGEFAALLNLVATDSGAKVLSTPHLIASNNQEAALRIGNEVPLLKEQRLDQNNSPIRTFEREKVGLELKMVPSIAQNRDVSLKLLLKNSSILEGTVNPETNQFNIANREVATDVVVNDQQTLVISGLIQDDASNASSGIPGVRKVPLLGRLFGQQSDSSTKKELLVFIRPQIIATEGEAQVASTGQMQEHPSAVNAANINLDMPEFDL